MFDWPPIVSLHHGKTPSVMTTESPTPDPEQLVSLAYASKVLSVTPMNLRRWIIAGTFPAHRIGKLYKVRASDLSQYLEASKVGGIGEDRSPV